MSPLGWIKKSAWDENSLDSTSVQERIYKSEITPTPFLRVSTSSLVYLEVNFGRFAVYNEYAK